MTLEIYQLNSHNGTPKFTSPSKLWKSEYLATISLLLYILSMINDPKGLWPVLLSVSLLLTLPSVTPAGQKIKVVTTIPTLKDFVGEVGGEKVEVISLLKGGEDLHTFDPRPSDTKTVSKAAILVKVGIGLDNWVERVIKASGNKNLLVIEASHGVGVIRADNDNTSHTVGNPHIWHDPDNAKIMVENIYKSLIKALPEETGYFKANRDIYTAKLSVLEKEMEETMSYIKDRKVVTYHPSWIYLLRRLQVKELFNIEKTPEREPSARDIATAINTIKREKIRLILSEPEAPRKIADIIAKESGAKVVILAPEVGSLPMIGSYIDMVKYNVGEISKGLKWNPS